MQIIPAAKEDTPLLVALMDSACRGEGSKQGWTSEADLFTGTKRTDEETVNRLMQYPGAVFLKSVNENGDLEGCVFLHKKTIVFIPACCRFRHWHRARVLAKNC